MSVSNTRIDGSHAASPVLSMGQVFRFWLPLAASWLLMSTETPIVTAVAARMGDPKSQLAGFGVAYSLVLMVESPIISMLTAGNALARDGAPLRLVRRFMLGLGLGLTVVMLLLDLTPLFDLIVLRVIGVPHEVAAVARSTMLAMIPWPAAIAYRRFHQGVMIRHGRTRAMGYGTALRLVSTVVVAVGGMLWERLDGGTVAGLALGCAVLVEAVFIHFVSRRVVRQVLAIPSSGSTLALGELLQFYAPLSLTSMIMLSTSPLLNSSMVRLPFPVASLAVWPVVNGQVMQMRSFGFSLQEAIVALLHRPGAKPVLRRFSVVVGSGAFLLLLTIAYTPLGAWWQRRIAGLDADLMAFALPALRWAVLLPVLAAVQSWLRGLLVNARSTSAIAWATAVNLAGLALVLWAGVVLGWLPGASLAAVALTISQCLESGWLWRGARGRMRRAAS